MTLEQGLGWLLAGASAFVIGTTAALFVAAHITWRRPFAVYVRVMVAGNTMLVAGVGGRALGLDRIEARALGLAGLVLEWAALVVMFHAALDADRRTRRSTDAPAAAGAALRAELDTICRADPSTPICRALELADEVAAIARDHVESMGAE